MAKKLTTITNDRQYYEYCNFLEYLEDKDDSSQEKIQEVYNLIKEWDDKHSTVPDLDPVQYLKLLMDNHKSSVFDLAANTSISAEKLTSVLLYKKRLSRKEIKTLCKLFSVSKEAFSRDYDLKRREFKKSKFFGFLLLVVLLNIACFFLLYVTYGRENVYHFILAMSLTGVSVGFLSTLLYHCFNIHN